MAANGRLGIQLATGSCHAVVGEAVSPMAKKNTAARVAITVAVIGLAGSLGAALINTLFKKDDTSKDESPSLAGISLSAPVQEFRVKCPHTFQFVGKIDVESGKGQ
jgi:hypothetical protein